MKNALNDVLKTISTLNINELKNLKKEITKKGKIKKKGTIKILNKEKITKMFSLWNELNSILKESDDRGINIPEAISENLLCILFPNIIRTKEKINDKDKSDCFDTVERKTIQVKSCSIQSDLSSFGPRAKQDYFILINFCPNGIVNGDFSIYKIENELVEKQEVSKGITFKQKQETGQRPRFSIMEKIIIPNKIEPIFSGNIYNI